MFGNGNGTYTQSRASQVTVNTKLTTLYGDDSMVSIGAWNDNLSIKFHPATGVSPEGVTQYQRDNNYITTVVITPDNARLLLEGINNEVIPALLSKASASVAVKTGAGNNLKLFVVGSDNGNPYMYVAKNLMNNIASDDNVVWHHFASRTYYSNYSYTDGTLTEVPVNVGFKNFIKKLEGIENITPYVPHAIKYSDAIRSAYAGNGGNGFNAASNNGGFNSQANSQPKYEAIVSNFDGNSSSDFLPFA